MVNDQKMDIGGYNRCPTCLAIFFFNDTATTEIYTLSLHDALPIYSAHGNSDSEKKQKKLPPYQNSWNKVINVNFDERKLTQHTFLDFSKALIV